jgi:hypothetical protein
MSENTSFTFAPVAGSPTLFKELADAVQLYLDLLYTCNVALVEQVFHEGAQLCTLEGDEPFYRSVSDYREVLRNRVSPESQGATRQEHLVSIDLSSATQAMVKVQMRINQYMFSDYLIFFRSHQSWRIVAKTFHRTEVVTFTSPRY